MKEDFNALLGALALSDILLSLASPPLSLAQQTSQVFSVNQNWLTKHGSITTDQKVTPNSLFLLEPEHRAQLQHLPPRPPSPDHSPNRTKFKAAVKPPSQAQAAAFSQV